MAVLDSLLYVAPYGHGIWKRALSQIVPVTLSHLSARIADELEEIEWRTESETNTQGFEIQRREAPEAEWSPIGFVRAKGSGTASMTYTHAYRPESSNAAARWTQYRLKILDFDGSIEYSRPVDVAADDGDAAFELHASYPNPANGRLMLSFSISRDSRVRLTVVNMLGMVVRDVVDADLRSGWYSHSVDTAELPSGTYLCVLKAGMKELTRTMTVKR